MRVKRDQIHGQICLFLASLPVVHVTGFSVRKNTAEDVGTNLGGGVWTLPGVIGAAASVRGLANSRRRPALPYRGGDRRRPMGWWAFAPLSNITNGMIGGSELARIAWMRCWKLIAVARGGVMAGLPVT